jgi:hypothetical protein
MKTLSRDAADSHLEIREHNEATRVPSRHERQHLAAMEDLGLADGEDAVQYALMLSMQEAEGSARGEGEEDVDDDEEMEAVRAVEQFTRKEIDDMREVLGLVRRAEERDRGDGDG